MALENLKENAEMERKLVKEIFLFYSQMQKLGKNSTRERELLRKAINSAAERLRLVNNSIPLLVNAVSSFKSLEKRQGKVKELVKLNYPDKKEGDVSVTLERKDREKYLKELNMKEEIFARLEKGTRKIKLELEFREPSLYAKISNKMFLPVSNSLINSGNFRGLNASMRKANMPYLVTTYVSMAFFSSFLILLIGMLIFVFLIFFSIKLTSPFIESSKFYLIPIVRNFIIAAILPFATFALFYSYPYAEAKSAESKINQELPFVALHMSAIAGSGIEPSQIFRIIISGKEYSNSKKEIKKVINQVNIYGYDLITALKNTARETSSKKLGELLNGMATTISGGGSLSEFLKKRAETLLFEYKLERDRYTKSAETFMDVYISIVIAAPMIMTLLLVLMSVSGIGVGLSPGMLSIVIISIIALINIVFLTYLHISQPSY